MKLFVSLAVMAVAAAAVGGDAAEEPDADDAWVEMENVRIDIGRLGAISDKTAEVWQKLRSDEYDSGYEERPASLGAALRRAVWQYNELREDLCHDRFMVEKSCGPPYVPKWAFESSKVIPSAAELRKRQEDLSDRVEPLWDAACDRLRKILEPRDTMYYCSIE